MNSEHFREVHSGRMAAASRHFEYVMAVETCRFRIVVAISLPSASSC